MGNELHILPKIDYTESLSNIEKVLNDMNTLDYYNKGKVKMKIKVTPNINEMYKRDVE